MQRTQQVILTMVAVVMGLIWATSSAAAATKINIDGDVSDWDHVSKVTTGSKAQVAMVVTKSTLYYYVAMNPTGTVAGNDNGWAASNDFQLYQAYQLQAGNQTYWLTPEPKLNGSYTPPTTVGSKTEVSVNVTGNWGAYNNTGVATGYVTAVKNSSQAGYQDVFEGEVPLLDLQLADDTAEFTLSSGSYSNLGNYTVTATRDTTATDTDTTGDDDAQTAEGDGTTTKGDAGKDYAGHPDIVIDGAFDDWANVDKTKIRESDDDYNVKDGAMVQYGGNLYIYINMSPNTGNGYARLQPSGYKLTIGNTTYDLTVENADGGTFTPLSSVGATQSITMGIYCAKTNSWTAKPDDVEGAATRVATQTGGSSDVFEIKLPLKDFKASSADGQTITLKNDNLGKQSMTVTGGSTGPVLLASSGFGIALFGLWQFNRRKRRHEGDQ